MSSIPQIDSKPSRALTLLLAAFAGMAPMSIDMYLPGIPAITTDLSASPQAVTATLSIFIGGLALGQLLAGPWSDRVGRQTPIVSGLILYFIGSLCAVFAHSVNIFLGGRVLQALGASAVMVAGRAVVRDLFDERGAAKYFSTLALVAGLAPVLAPIVGTGLLTVGSWRAIFMLMTSVAVILLLVVIWKLYETRSSETERQARASHPIKTYALLLRNRRLLGYLLAGGFNSACFFTYLGSAPLVLMKIYGLSPTTFSIIMACNSFGLVTASQFSRHLLKTRSPQQVLQGSARNAIVMAVVFAGFAITLVGGLPVLLLLVFMVVASLSIVQANTMACALSVDPHRAGATAALFGTMVFGVGTATSFIAGLLYDGTPRPMLGVIALNLVGTAVVLRFMALPKTEITAS
ncbi:MAG: multidrug effflux MFS transporter [Steroidobacteraceae bacterium]